MYPAVVRSEEAARATQDAGGDDGAKIAVASRRATEFLPVVGDAQMPEGAGCGEQVDQALRSMPSRYSMA